MRGLLVIAILGVPQDKSPRTFEWKLEPNTVLEYEAFDAKSNQPAEGFFLFASEFRKDGGNRLVIDRYEDLANPLLFRLPRGEVKPGHSWEHAAFFFHEASESTSVWSWTGPTSLKPVHAKGRLVFKKLEKAGDDELAWLEGAFDLVEIRRDIVNNRLKLSITKNKVGTITTSAAFSFNRGLLVRGQIHLDLPRAQERIFQKGEWRVEDRALRVARRFELKEVVKLDPEKMAKAVESGLRKAGNWLRKQQKGAGEFGVARTMEMDRVDAGVTGLAVGALLASGAKPDDEVVQKGLRSLRTNPGPKTPQTYAHAATAIVARFLPGVPWTDHKLSELREAFRKNFPKEDLVALRSCADALLESRDRKLWAWAPSAKRGLDTLNPLSTRHAAEALFHAHLAGVEIPAEAWRGWIDLYANSGADEEDEIELELSFVEGFEEESKKVFPASWRFETARKNGDDPTRTRDLKGTSLTTLAVMETLAMARAATSLGETQRKSVNAALRKGFAWIQWRWTLRTPPPSEASWSVQKLEYYYLLMRVFTGLGIRTIGGSDWYLEGAYLLLREQFEDGSWDSSGGTTLLDTACAMLFLARGALRLPPAK